MTVTISRLYSSYAEAREAVAGGTGVLRQIDRAPSAFTQFFDDPVVT